MKRTLMDKVVGFFSPEAEARRVQGRIAAEMSLRAYDAAADFRTSDWRSASRSDANSEVKIGAKALRERSRDLARNNPYGVRALDVIESNTVGAGIVANIKGGNKSSTKKLNELWKLWAESTAIDAEGRMDLYGLQAMVLRSTAESGEAFAVKRNTKLGPKIQLLEGEFVDQTKDEGSVIQGIEVDSNGIRTKYHVFKAHPGGPNSSAETVVLPASDVAHVFKPGRPGQMRGVPWAHSIIDKMKDLEDYNRATLIRQKVAACFGGVITTTGGDSLMSAERLAAKRQADFEMEPAMFRHLAPGEDMKLISPPPVEGYSEFIRETLRAAAAGYGISYEALTGDYSQVNFSSGRMGHLEMKRNIESWRWRMLIPQFNDWVFYSVFLPYAQIMGAQIEGATVDWVPPAYSMIDPTKEIESLKREVRSGFKTYGQAVREQGLDPDAVLIEFAEWNKKFDDLKVAFDSDPRRMSSVGFSQPVDTLPKLAPEAPYLQPNEVNTNNENQEDVAEQSDSSGAE